MVHNVKCSAVSGWGCKSSQWSSCLFVVIKLIKLACYKLHLSSSWNYIIMRRVCILLWVWWRMLYLVRWCWQRVHWQERWAQSLIGTAGTEWSLQANPREMERARSSGCGGVGRRGGRMGTVPGYWRLLAPLGYYCCCWTSRRRWLLSLDQTPFLWGGHQSSQTGPRTEGFTVSTCEAQPSIQIIGDMQQVANVSISSCKHNFFYC